MKKQEKGKSNLHAGDEFVDKLESMNLDPRLSKLIQKYQRGFWSVDPTPVLQKTGPDGPQTQN